MKASLCLTSDSEKDRVVRKQRVSAILVGEDAFCAMLASQLAWGLQPFSAFRFRRIASVSVWMVLQNDFEAHTIASKFPLCIL